MCSKYYSKLLCCCDIYKTLQTNPSVFSVFSYPPAMSRICINLPLLLSIFSLSYIHTHFARRVSRLKSESRVVSKGPLVVHANIFCVGYSQLLLSICFVDFTHCVAPQVSLASQSICNIPSCVADSK